MDSTKIQTHKMTVLIKGMIISYLITGAALVILSVLLLKVRMEESTVNIGIIMVYVISCLAGGFLAGKMAEEKKYIWGLLLGMLYFFLLLLLSLFFIREASMDVKHLLTSFALCAGSGMLGGMLA